MKIILKAEGKSTSYTARRISNVYVYICKRPVTAHFFFRGCASGMISSRCWSNEMRIKAGDPGEVSERVERAATVQVIHLIFFFPFFWVVGTPSHFL